MGHGVSYPCYRCGNGGAKRLRDWSVIIHQAKKVTPPSDSWSSLISPPSHPSALTFPLSTYRGWASEAIKGAGKIIIIVKKKNPRIRIKGPVRPSSPAVFNPDYPLEFPEELKYVEINTYARVQASAVFFKLCSWFCSNFGRELLNESSNHHHPRFHVQTYGLPGASINGSVLYPLAPKYTAYLSSMSYRVRKLDCELGKSINSSEAPNREVTCLSTPSEPVTEQE